MVVGIQQRDVSSDGLLIAVWRHPLKSGLTAAGASAPGLSETAISKSAGAHVWDLSTKSNARCAAIGQPLQVSLTVRPSGCRQRHQARQRV